MNSGASADSIESGKEEVCRVRTKETTVKINN